MHCSHLFAQLTHIIITSQSSIEQLLMGNCDNKQTLDDIHSPVLGRLGPVTDLKIINLVWQKDYQGLFDYQSKDILRSTYIVKSNSLILSEKDRKVVKETVSQNIREQMLKNAAFQIIRKNNYYKILPIYIDSQEYTLQKLLWLIVKTVPNHRYPIKERDIIKFGKQKVKVRQIMLNELQPTQHQELHLIKTNKKVYDDLKLNENVEPQLNAYAKEGVVNQIQSVVTENELTCRICLEPGQYTNPLICACKCTGSVRYIHLQCLRTWLGKRLNFSISKFCTSIKWVPLTCQMCKTKYRYRIYLDNKKFYTVQIPKPGKPYIVLQVMKKTTDGAKLFHFVSLAQTSKVSIGRKKEIDVKISDDVSVSRHHANFIYDFQNRRFLVQDNKSKFGTLVLIKRNLLINPFQRGISFQMGGQVFLFDTQRGEGSNPDYHDQENYLNVVESDEKHEVDEEESEQQNNEQFEDEEEEQEVHNIPTHANLHHSNIISENNSSIIHPSNRSAVVNPPLQVIAPNPPLLNQVPEAQEFL